MKLSALQRALFHAIAGEQSAAAAAAHVRGGALSAEERIGVYAGMYFLRMRDALADDFSRTRAVMGEGPFDDAVRGYMARYPSMHHSLAQFGREFPAFLGRRRGRGRADLPSLAALEWARSRSFVAPEAPVTSPSAVATLGAEVFANATLRLHPSVHVLKLSFDALALFRAVDAKAALPRPRRAPVRCVVWRKGFEVFHVAIDGPEFTALSRAATGASIAAICQPFAVKGQGPRRAFRAIASWLHEGMVSEVISGGRTAPRRPRRRG